MALERSDRDLSGQVRGADPPSQGLRTWPVPDYSAILKVAEPERADEWRWRWPGEEEELTLEEDELTLEEDGP